MVHHVTRLFQVFHTTWPDYFMSFTTSPGYFWCFTACDLVFSCVLHHVTWLFQVFYTMWPGYFGCFTPCDLVISGVFTPCDLVISGVLHHVTRLLWHNVIVLIDNLLFQLAISQCTTMLIFTTIKDKPTSCKHVWTELGVRWDDPFDSDIFNFFNPATNKQKQ